MQAPDAVPRVAVVGSGPSGLYTVTALLAADQPLAVDVLDRLPTPYGLVRYGVAPDHAKMKSVVRVLAKPFVRPPTAPQQVRFLGNVDVGRDLTAAELGEHYHAVVHASGTEHDRLVGIPGEGMPGSIGAGELVRWYNGHPDAGEIVLDAERVVVVGAGNVALDVARVLARTAEEMRDTDVPDRVLAAMSRSRVREVHVLVRRGPRDARFTPAELFGLSELAAAEVVVHAGPEDLAPDEADDKRVRQNLDVLRGWLPHPSGRGRRVHLHFHTAPVEILGTDRVAGVVVERAGVRSTIDAGLVVSAVGFRGGPVPGLPFDEATGSVPNAAGRVLHGADVVAGRYVAGWIKRGPRGIIGTNRPDGAETAAAVLADLPALVAARPAPPTDVLDLLVRRGHHTVDWAGWLRLDEHEGRLGASTGRGRVKVPDIAAMLAAVGPDPDHP